MMGPFKTINNQTALVMSIPNSEISHEDSPNDWEDMHSVIPWVSHHGAFSSRIIHSFCLPNVKYIYKYIDICIHNIYQWVVLKILTDCIQWHGTQLQLPSIWRVQGTGIGLKGCCSVYFHRSQRAPKSVLKLENGTSLCVFHVCFV